jgi:hypothetical protein
MVVANRIHPLEPVVLLSRGLACYASTYAVQKILRLFNYSGKLVDKVPELIDICNIFPEK